MKLFAERSKQQETMDDFDCQGEVLHQTLRELDFINQALGGNAVTFKALDTVKEIFPRDRPITIADLGCGSGEMLILVNKWAHKNGFSVHLTGIDVNPHIIEYAKRHCSGHSNIEFLALDIFSKDFTQRNFDIVLSSLFTHHFSESQLVEYYSNSLKQSKIAVITNDLHRHPLAYYSIKWLTGLFSKSAMVRFDAPVSVLRGFKKTELKSILEKAGVKHFSLNWKWAFRWNLIIYAK